MRASPLRELARRYAAGNLRREDYLAQRSQLIRAYVSGRQAIAYRDARPVVLVRQRALNGWLIALAAGVPLLLALLIWLALPARPPDAPTGTNAAAQQRADATGEKLIAGFLNEGDWSESRLQAFELDWMELTPFQRETARRSPWYRRLDAAVHRKLGELDALQALQEDPRARLREIRLRDFARRMGIELEHAAPPPPDDDE